MKDAINAFLLAFPALFSIVNPVSGLFIFREVTMARAPVERANLARLVGAYSLVVMLVALWAGSHVLAFFGITLAALRVAGGFVVAMNAWTLLQTPDRSDTSGQDSGLPAPDAHEIAFFPLTIPFTTGPGTIAVAVALGASQPRLAPDYGWFLAGSSAAALLLALVIWLLYRSADRMSRMLGPAGSRTISRMAAFLLLCIGVQILITGVQDVFTPLLAARG